MEEKKEQIYKRVFKHPDAEELYIKRVPSKTVKRFREFCDEHFCGDYGMALKHMIDFSMVFGPTIDGIHAAIVELDSRVGVIESKSETTPTRKTLSGKELGGNRK